jgi:putative PIN family toxin of toxin-antitoxin system
MRRSWFMITEKQPEERLRVVLDTNVYISIFTNPKGELGAIWEHALKGTYTLLISPAIVAELANVLREKFKWPENDIKARAKRFARMAEIITPKIVPTIVKDDPTDNHILACAREGQADLIVSGDKHLRRIKVYEGIPIIRPTDFLHTLTGYPMK